MKVLTVKQPYASLIVIGRKPFEYRAWQTSYRGPVIVLATTLSTGERDRHFPLRAFVGMFTLGDIQKTTNGYAWSIINPIAFKVPVKSKRHYFSMSDITSEDLSRIAVANGISIPTVERKQ